MKKTLALALALVTLVSTNAFAKIHCSVDNLRDEITYKANKKIMYFNSVTTIDFIKIVKSDEQANAYVLVNFHGMRKKILENRAELIVDGVVYPMKKSIPTFYVFQDPGVTVGNFKVPTEALPAIASFKDKIAFQFYIKGKEPKELTMGKKENEEIRLITSLKYTDFEAVDKGLIKVETDD